MLGIKPWTIEPTRGIPRKLFQRGVTPGIFSGGGGSTNSVEDRWEREWRSVGGSPLASGSNQFANE
jgi:hypothetical protein